MHRHKYCLIFTIAIRQGIGQQDKPDEGGQKITNDDLAIPNTQVHNILGVYNSLSLFKNCV